MPTNHICNNCGGKMVSGFYEVRDIPVNSCILMPTQQQALKFPRGDIVLAFCEECGFISNTAFDSSKVDYSPVYEDQQCYSSTFDAFAQNLAKRLIKKHDLRKKTVLEIGCGKGDFLAMLCELGDNHGVGIDPAYVEGRVPSSTSKRLKFIRDYYSERYASYHGDMVVCRHTLEHISETKRFVDAVRRAIGNRSEAIVFFEVPDVARVLHELAFWDIYYEHCSYYTLGSLARLFRSCGFEVTDLSKDFDDQYLLIEARPVGKTSEKKHELEETVEVTAKDVEYFSSHYRNKLGEWKERLNQIHTDGKRAVVWGSGSKCVAFLTTLRVKDEIQYVVDINPFRHGRFLPSAGKKIIPPEFLREYNPDVAIIMNPIYHDEIEQMLDNMGLSPQVVLV